MRRAHPRPKRRGRPVLGLCSRGLLAILFACGALIGLAAEAAAQPQPGRAEPKILRGGWFPLDPYQYREYRRGTAVLTGFDVEIERALGRILHLDIQLPEVAWEEHLAAVAAGKADIAANATFSEERNRYAYFSKPYRRETNVLVLRRGMSTRYQFTDVAQMLEAFERQRFRLGVIAGFIYANDKVNAYVDDPAHDATIVKVGDDTQLFPEIAVAWGVAFSLFLGWEAERLQPEEIWLGVIVTIAGVFVTRITAIAFGLRGWPYA
jgi:polar amino acid transport system substrate-binding protein